MLHVFKLSLHTLARHVCDLHQGLVYSRLQLLSASKRRPRIQWGQHSEEPEGGYGREWQDCLMRGASLV